MMRNGYCLIVRNYKAEIVEFVTKSIITMPDGSILYLIHTKYGDEYYHEDDLSPTKETFEKECEELNITLSKAKGDSSGAEKWIYKPR